MLYLGCHLSTSKGFTSMADVALQLQGNTFQFFTRNPRGSSRKALDKKDLEQFLEITSEHNFGPLLGHAPYTLNPASDKEHVLDFALQAMREDLDRLELFPHVFYNFHPGSHVGQGVEEGIKKIVNLLNSILIPGQKTMVLLETMAGKGTEIGRTFEELAEIIGQVEHPELMGVCLDTCHIHDAGYPISTDLEGVLEEFDRVVGLSRLKALHLNDSKNPQGAKKDRHAKLGEGYIGLATFEKIVNHPFLKTLPMFLETPQEDVSGYGKEIELLRNLEK